MPAIAFLVVSFLCGFEITKRMKVNICGQIAAGMLNTEPEKQIFAKYLTGGKNNEKK